MVTLLAPSAKAVFDVSDLVSISVVASTVAAPAEVTSAAEILTDATPFESVNAVPEVGESLASVSFVVNVMTALLAALPSAFFATTFTTPGLLLEIAVFAAPETGSSKLIDNVGSAVLPPPVPPPPLVPSGDFAPPPPQAAMLAKSDAVSKVLNNDTNRASGRLNKAALLINTLRKCFKRTIVAHSRQH